MEHEISTHIIAAVRNDEELADAVKSGVNVIFHLNADINNLSDVVENAHKHNKKIFIHIDLAEGIGKDKSGLLFLKNAGVDGIISTKVSIIKAAKDAGMFTVQRVFIIDSRSVGTTVDAVKSSKADMIEVMPGVVTKAIKKLCATLNVPVIAGGLIETDAEIKKALLSGAFSVSVGKKELWR